MTSERRECGVVKPPITPEMIEEGFDELYGFRITDPDHEEMREAVRAVFVRMLSSSCCLERLSHLRSNA